MKHLKKFENFSILNKDIEEININDLSRILEKDIRPWIIAKQSESLSGAAPTYKDIPILSSEEIFKRAEDKYVPIIIIDEDAFPSIPYNLLNKCNLAIVQLDDKYFDEDIKYTTTKVYRMLY